MSLWMQETWVAVESRELPDGSIDDRGTRLGDSEVYETDHDKPGDLFRSCQREFGRCTSKVYVGEDPAKVKVIGWVFEKRVPHRDRWENPTGGSYMQQTWVTVHEKPPTETVTYHYAELR